ncbi:MAG: tRNA pseudouridine38-40 synthase [Clostridia bacterium]|nr:tRNA pseudouridine38-40 synthase [Clostridia bacterium]
MPYLKVILAYEGTNYCGWQAQPDEHGPSVQGTVEKALKKLTGEEIRVTAAGRTDAGVHARGQVISFATGSKIPLERWPLALNAVLPPDIAALRAEEVGPEFHARYSAHSKTYRYTILNSPLRDVFWRRFSWHIRQPLNIEVMEEALAYLKGQHDFRAFCAAGSPVKNFVRTIKDARLRKEGCLINLDIKADGFLYHMARIIAGTLVEVGQGRLKAEAIPEILASRDRGRAGPTAPPHGLCLMEVEY